MGLTMAPGGAANVFMVGDSDRGTPIYRTYPFAELETDTYGICSTRTYCPDTYTVNYSVYSDYSYVDEGDKVARAKAARLRWIRFTHGLDSKPRTKPWFPKYQMPRWHAPPAIQRPPWQRSVRKFKLPAIVRQGRSAIKAVGQRKSHRLVWAAQPRETNCNW